MLQFFLCIFFFHFFSSSSSFFTFASFLAFHFLNLQFFHYLFSFFFENYLSVCLWRTCLPSKMVFHSYFYAPILDYFAIRRHGAACPCLSFLFYYYFPFISHYFSGSIGFIFLSGLLLFSRFFFYFCIMGTFYLTIFSLSSHRLLLKS